MENSHIGSLITVDCGGGNYYQGKLTTVDSNTKNMTLANVFKQGHPLGKCITISPNDIVSLKVLRTPDRKQSPAKKGNLPSICSVGQTKAVEKEVEKKIPSNIVKSEKQPVQKSILDKLFEPQPAQANVKSDPVSPQATNKGNKVRGGRHSPMTEKKITEEISATPLFRTYERQVPHPTSLVSVAPGKPNKACNKKQGPSGIPLVDALNHYTGSGRRNKDDLFNVSKDIDLDSDFDFQENNKLFKKTDDDDVYYETVEKQKCSRNFAHYENIVEDNNRVFSWTNLKSRMTSSDESQSQTDGKYKVNSVSFEKSFGGHPVPAINQQQKKEFLKACSESMGETVYEITTADRVFNFVCEIQEEHGNVQGTIVLIASSRTSVRFIRRIATHFDKRGYNCYLYGKYPGEQFDNIEIVQEIRQLPESPIVCLLAQDIPEDVETWLRAQNESHFVCIESVPAALDPTRIHLLMYGCATSGIRHSEKVVTVTTGRTCFESLCQPPKSTVVIDSAVADIGNPSNWFDDCSRKYIAAVFATTFLVRLSSD